MVSMMPVGFNPAAVKLKPKSQVPETNEESTSNEEPKEAPKPRKLPPGAVPMGMGMGPGFDPTTVKLKPRGPPKQ